MGRQINNLNNSNYENGTLAWFDNLASSNTRLVPSKLMPPDASERQLVLYIQDPRVSKLIEKVDRIEERLDTLEDGTYSEIINLRDISLSQAKQEIADYFKAHDGEQIDYEELLNSLKIDLPTIITACSELEAEGKIG
jgi:hypothetical protein